MSLPEVSVDELATDDSCVLATLEEIRRFVPQRFEFGQLTAIVLDDSVRNICAAFKDVGQYEFWVRGHLPYRPLMPGFGGSSLGLSRG